MALATGRTLIHPFDDALVIAGQGTIAMEIFGQMRDGLEAIFVPVGGGGLIAGIASYVKAIRPEVKVIGVEPFEADAMYRSLEAGRRVIDCHGLKSADRCGFFRSSGKFPAGKTAGKGHGQGGVVPARSWQMA